MARLHNRRFNLSTFGWLLCAPIATTLAASWFDFSLGWKLNWRLMLDLMAHKEFNAPSNGSAVGEPANATQGVSLLDLMLRLNGVRDEQEGQL